MRFLCSENIRVYFLGRRPARNFDRLPVRPIHGVKVFRRVPHQRLQQPFQPQAKNTRSPHNAISLQIRTRVKTAMSRACQLHKQGRKVSSICADSVGAHIPSPSDTEYQVLFCSLLQVPMLRFTIFRLSHKQRQVTTEHTEIL